MKIFIGILLPFLGTTLGASLVFCMKKLNKKLENVLLGIASGVMIAASIWSLLIPSMEMAASYGKNAWFPATIGFSVGIGFFILIERFLEKLNIKVAKENISEMKKNIMLFLSVTLHNIPEGMAVGVALAGALSGNGSMTYLVAITIAIRCCNPKYSRRSNNINAIKIIRKV